MNRPESSGPTGSGCRRSVEIDLAEFLAHAAAPRWREFREHYPLCPQCAAEVRAWTEVHAALSAETSAHPDPELLGRFESRSPQLSAEQRAAVEGHLEVCASCRDELAALARFDPAVFRQPARVRPKEEGSPLAAWLERLRSVVWHPAFAYALVLLLLLPILGRLREEGAAPMSRAVRERLSFQPEEQHDRRLLAEKDLAEKTASGAAEFRSANESEKRLAAGSGVERPAPRAESQLPAREVVPPVPVAKRKALGDGDGLWAGSAAPEPSLAGEGKGGVGSGGVAMPEVPAAAAPAAASKEEAELGRALRGQRPDAAANVVDLEATGAISRAALRNGAEIVLRIRRPPALPADSTGWVRLRSADGTRELREPIPAGPSVELRVPAAWLRSGSYLFQVGSEPAGVLDTRTLTVE